MKKIGLFITAMVFILASISNAAITTITDKHLKGHVNDYMKKHAWEEVDANFNDLDTTKLDIDGDGASITGIVPAGIDVTNDFFIYGAGGVGSEYNFNSSRFTETGSEIDVNEAGFTGIVPAGVDVTNDFFIYGAGGVGSEYNFNSSRFTETGSEIDVNEAGFTGIPVGGVTVHWLCREHLSAAIYGHVLWVWVLYEWLCSFIQQKCAGRI